jgi:hypothetical protein
MNKPSLAAPQKDHGKAVMHRLTALARQIKAGLAGPEQANLRLLVNGVHDQLKKKNFATASRVLDTLEKALSRAPAAAPSPAATPAPASGSITRRLNQLVPGLKSALAGPGAARIQDLLGSTQAHLKSGDFAQASAQLDELEALVQGRAEPAAAKPRIAPEIVYRHARLEYDRARKAAHAGVDAVQQAILKEAAGDPQLKLIQEGVARLDSALERLDDRLLDALDAGLNARDAKVRGQHAKKAIKHVNAYLRFIKSDELLEFVDTNEFHKAKVRAPLFQALKKIKAELAK